MPAVLSILCGQRPDLGVLERGGGAASCPSRDPATSDPHIFRLPFGCLSPLSPPLMTSATTLLQNYLAAVLISLCGRLIKITSPTSFSLGPALSSTNGPLSWPVARLCPCLCRLLGETSWHHSDTSPWGLALLPHTNVPGPKYPKMCLGLWFDSDTVRPRDQEPGAT